MRGQTLCVILGLLVAACASAPKPKPASNEPVRTSASVIHGRAFFLERMLLAPGATLEVQLIGEPPADPAKASTVAMMRFDDLHGPPYDFALPYDPARIDSSLHYGLRSMLRDAQGHLEFVTGALVPVVPGNEARVEFRLVRASAERTDATDR